LPPRGRNSSLAADRPPFFFGEPPFKDGMASKTVALLIVSVVGIVVLAAATGSIDLFRAGRVELVWADGLEKK
jgi:hypothetical protein